jgi:c-di-GMP-binding flagellar brake protein YcgR
LQNKRQHPRVTIKSIGEIFCPDDNRRFKAFVGGISRGGLEIYSEESVHRDCRVKISLSFLNKEGRPIVENLAGQVRWAAPFQDAYVAGIQFDSLVDRDTTPSLADYIENAERYFT